MTKATEHVYTSKLRARGSRQGNELRLTAIHG
jgi:hypothetical protein